METALKLKIKHLYSRERAIIVQFKGNTQFLFIQMMKLRLGLILNSRLNRAETVSSVPQKGVFPHSRGRHTKYFLGASPSPPFPNRIPYGKTFIVKVPKHLTGLPHICPQIQFSCLWACYFLANHSFSTIRCGYHAPEFHCIKHCKFCWPRLSVIGHAHCCRRTQA